MNADGSRHPPDLVQPEPRPRPGGAGQRPGRVQPLGQRSRARRDQPVRDEPGRHGPASCSTARTATTPAPNGADVQFLEPRAMANGQPARARAPFEAADLGGELVDDRDGELRREHAADRAERRRADGPRTGARRPSMTCARSTGPSPGGRYSSAYPLHDGTGRMLVSWTQCRLLEAPTPQIVPCTTSARGSSHAVAAPPLYGVWIYDPSQRTHSCPLRARRKASMFSDIVALQPRRVAAGICSIRLPASTSMPT